MTHSILSEIQYEDPKAHESFLENVRHQIVVKCQDIRISLVLVDHLMYLYNDAVTAGKITPGMFKN